MYSSIIKAEAEQLRRAELTYLEISEKLGVPKSTLSTWLRELPLPAGSSPEAKRAYFLRNVQHKGAAANSQKRHTMWQELRAEAQLALSTYDLSNKQLLMGMLSTLYWAEGTKYDKGGIVFTNTDPRLAYLFLTLLRSLERIDESRLRVRLHLHDYHDKAQAVRFWSRTLHIPEDQFQSTYIKKRNPGKKFRQNFMGICFIKYGDSKTRRKVLSYAYVIQERLAPVAQLD